MVVPDSDGGDGDGSDFFGHAHGQAGECLELGTLEAQVDFPPLDFGAAAGLLGILKFVERGPRVPVLARCDGRFPEAVVETRAGPAGHFLPRIITFTHLQVGLLNGTGAGHFPGLVGGNQFPRAVGVLEFQLRHDRRCLAIRVTADMFRADPREQAEADVSAVPAVSHPRAQRVVARLDQRSDIVGLIVTRVDGNRSNRVQTTRRRRVDRSRAIRRYPVPSRRSWRV